MAASDIDREISRQSEISAGAAAQWAHDMEISASIVQNAIDASHIKPWIKCSDRLPTKGDGDHRGEIWWGWKYAHDEWQSHLGAIGPTPVQATHWQPTGLKRPDAPTP